MNMPKASLTGMVETLFFLNKEDVNESNRHEFMTFCKNIMHAHHNTKFKEFILQYKLFNGLLKFGLCND